MDKKESMKSVFHSLLKGDSVKISENVAVNFDVFYNFFKEVESVSSYKDYINLDNGKGYIAFFDKCKEKGILN